MFTDMDEKQKMKLEKLIAVLLKDKDGSYFLKQMDKAQVEKAVLLIIDGGIGLGEADMSIEEIYEVHYRVLKQWPDRYIIFGGIDPRRGEKGFDLFRKGVEHFGFRGLKLYPPMGYSMDHDGLLPIYDYCDQNRLPVLLHTGPSQAGLLNELADPLLIRPVAEKFKNINFILAHAGFNLTNDVIDLVESFDNIFLDLAGFRARYKSVNEEMINNFKPLFLGKLNTRVLFGNDWPLFNLITPVVKNVEMLQELGDIIAGKNSSALKNILFNNAQAVLNN